MIIGIIGSGTMGAGIAQVASQSGHQVFVIDTNQDVLLKAQANLKSTLEKLVAKNKMSQVSADEIYQRISWQTKIESLAGCGLVIEAIVEKLEVKKSVFIQLESIVSLDCILASNTSSLSITSIAATCKHPERVIGIHFFNPAPLMELVEIIPALQTAQDNIEKAKSLIDSWSKISVLTKDTPGFIVNRIARPYYSEAIRIFEEGASSIETIDLAMKQLAGFRMGPFELMDLIGHDVNYVVTETVWEAFYFDTRYTPSFTQKRLLEANWLGKKTGRGFYNYTSSEQKLETILDEFSAQQIVNRILVMLINEAANALFLRIASKEDIDIAMTKGVNYPKGLLKWADEIGIGQCVDRLDELYHEYHEDRYRCSPLLRKMKKDQTNFYT